VVYFASEDGKLYALSPQGAELWSYDIGHRFIMSSPAIGADGTIYFGDYDGNFYAVGN
jgi:outer membrane protein assembly factor BamB